MLEHRTVDRVEKGLGDLEIVVATNHFGVDGTHMAPELQIVQVVAGDNLNVLQHLVGLDLVQVDTFDGGLLHAQPVSVFKARLGRQGHVLEFGKVGFKAVEDGARKALTLFHGKLPGWAARP